MFDDNDEYIDYDRLVDESEDLMDDDYYDDWNYSPGILYPESFPYPLDSNKIN